MRRRRLGRLVAAASAAGAAAAAGAQGAPFVALPSPTSAFRPEPPLLGAGAVTTERRIPGRISARTLVDVTVAGDGRPLRVSALNRLLVRGTGDYTFAVAAPAEAASAGPNSESAPGLRRGGVLWQGFAVEHRLLVARIRLAEGAAGSLPLRISTVGGAIEIANATTARTSVETAPADARVVAARLDEVRTAVAHGVASASLTVPRTGRVRTVKATIRAPLRLTGVYRFGDGRVRRLSTTLDDRPVRLTGTGELTRLELTATTVPVGQLLAPPMRRTWAAFAAAGGFPRDAVSFAASRLLRAALATQYQSFLANPDTFGPSATVYRFVLGSVPTPALRTPGEEGGTRWWAWLAAAVGVAIALGGAVVAWAHS